MEENRSKRINSVVASVIIHALALAAFLFSHPSPKMDVCMVVPIDETNPRFPLYEEMTAPENPKPAVAALNSIQKEDIRPAIEQSSLEKETRNPETVSPPAAEIKIIEPLSQNEPPKSEPVRTPAESSLASFREPLEGSIRNGLGAAMPASGNLGGGGNPQSSTHGNGGAGSGSIGQSSGNEIGNASFGSPMGPKFRHRKMPEYPMAARKQKREGIVVLAITIDKNGDLKDVEILEASDPLFIKPSIEALKKSSFLPASRNGTPMAVKAILPIRFALQE
jgi:periplasmic protein TonB